MQNPVDPIHSLVVENVRPGEQGQSALEVLPHGIYVQVTASPFFLVLQRSSSSIRPTLPFLLEPGAGYCGGEIFFGGFDPDSEERPAPPPVLVPGSRRRIAEPPSSHTPGLAASIELAIVSSAVLALSVGRIISCRGPRCS